MSRKQTSTNEHFNNNAGDTAPLISGAAATSIYQNKCFLATVIIATILFLVVLLQFAWASTTTILLISWRKPQPEITEDPNLIHIIAFNDVYEINPVQYRGSEKRGGVSRVSQYVKDLKKNAKNVLVLFAGDMISPSLQSTLFNGKQMIETNNILGINYAVLGNHEFDFGYPVLIDRVKDSKFKWMAANLRFVDNNTAIVPLVEDNVLVQVGPVKFGIFGVVYDMRETIKNATGMIFKDPFVTATEQVSYLKKEGAQFIVALTHMFQDDDCKLSQRVPGIDLVVGGHDHLMQANSQCSPLTPYVKATQDYQNIWHIKINFGAKTGVPSIDFNNVPITTDLPTDPEVEALIAQYNAKTEDEFKVVLGVTETPIDTVSASLRSQETSGGNLVADVIRTSAKADVGFINGGGIRANRVFPAGSLSVGDVVAMLPFQNFVNLLRVNGAILRAALERGFCCIDEQFGGFPVISGIQVTYKKTGTPHVQTLQWLNGTDIQADETFTLVTSDYMAGGGDGFTMFKSAEHIFDPVLDSTLVSGLVMNYIKEAKVIRPVVDGREKRLD